MRKRFKGRHHKTGSNIFKLIILILIIILSFIITFKFLFNKLNKSINLNQEKYLNYLVNDAFGRYKLEDLKILSSTDFLLKYSFGLNKINTGLVEKEVELPQDKIEVVPSEQIEEPVINTEPIIYIFNSHQTEEYKSSFLENFNINNTVLLASYILKEYLADLNLYSLVEENSIVDVLNANGWKYGSSYKASRILLEEASKNNPSLKYFIDLHRDSASYERTTLDIEGVKYAKVLFVIGLKNENYEKNLAMATAIDAKLKEYNPSISRGIIKKEGKGVNGIYNQDFNENTILIEVGGQYNSIEEVNNTLKVLANIIYSYIGERENAEKEK